MTITQNVPDPKWIKQCLREAADTLRRLPRAHTKPRLAAWPDVVRNSAPYQSAPKRTRPAAPSPAAIDRLDESLHWMFACSPEQRRIVWARACGVPWRKLEDIDGRSHVTLRRIEDQGVSAIRDRLRSTIRKRAFDAPM
ncbi:DUF6362 family protein [Nisaea acidiphila]|uniref:DUF6362 family protein n=1 Tax=Nisaea acidiphila TaxID=1862145 RepID=A0A9J7AZE2_9PROT|nr:DUF6362 family protein [Nisaea acidiphila]UUX51793.1 DUF6362 family protein [Nisaea acidiphila]